MALRIRKLIEDHGYRSVSEFVTVATRKRIEELESWDKYVQSKKEKYSKRMKG